MTADMMAALTAPATTKRKPSERPETALWRCVAALHTAADIIEDHGEYPHGVSHDRSELIELAEELDDFATRLEASR